MAYPLLDVPGELGVLLRFRRRETPQRQQTPLDAPSRDLRKTSPDEKDQGNERRDRVEWLRKGHASQNLGATWPGQVDAININSCR